MANLSTPTARRKITFSEKGSWVRIARGRALGYRRRGSQAGIWYVRLFVGRGGEKSPYLRRALGTADDFAPADGVSVLTFSQAMEKTLAWEPGEEEDEDQRRPLTVRRAVERYLAWYKSHRRSYDCIRSNLEAHVLPELGELRVETLTTERLRKWHQKLAESPARLRGGNLRKATTEDAKRARKVTANHLLKDLKAALNRALEDGLIENGEAWRRVRPFQGVEVARSRYLEPEELRRFVNACRPDFRELAQAAVYTGARYSELAGLRVDEFRPEASAVHFSKTKSGAPRFQPTYTVGWRAISTFCKGGLDAIRLIRNSSG